MADKSGQADLRKQEWEKDVKGFALQEFRMKQLVMISTTNAWTNSYYQETSTELSASGTRNIKGIGRFSEFPSAKVSWTERSARIEKYGLKDHIAWEDAMTNNIDVIARTLLRIARGVSKSVDDEIWDSLSESQSPSTINSVSISVGNEWDSSTIANRDPVQDILNAAKEISIDNYDPYTNQTYLVMNTTDFANCLGNNKFLKLYKEEIATNGRVGSILGHELIVSNSVTADYAMLVISNMCGTWKAAEPLKVHIKETPGENYEIKAWEMGVTQLTNPNAVCLISNTQE